MTPSNSKGVSESGLKEHKLPLVDMETGATQDITVVCGYYQTDMGNAQRLVAYYGDIIRYCAELGMWFIWDDVRWMRDTTLTIRELAKDTVRLIHAEVSFLDTGDRLETKNARKALSKWAYQSEANYHINAMIKLAQSDPRIAVKANVFDAKLELMNCPNGTLDFKRREFREHRREDLLTKVTAALFDPSVECKLFYQTLFDALPPEQIVYLQRMLGSMLEATTQNKEYLIIYGKPYARKSSVTQPVYAALGDYAKPIDISLLTKSKHGIASNAARPELIALEGVRIAWTEETPEGMVFDESMLKGITSSGKKPARNLFEKQRDLELQASFVIETNNPPTIEITDEWQREALLERTCVVKFVNAVPRDMRDTNVLKRLTHDEKELTAALAFVVQGRFDRLDYGLEVPESVKQISEEFETTFNPLVTFVKNEVIFENGTDDNGRITYQVQTTVSDLFERFLETTDTETRKKVANPRSFNVHFKKIAPYYAKQAGVEVQSRKRTHGVEWLNVRLAEISDDSEFEALEKDDDANTQKMTQNSDLVKPISSLSQLYEYFDQKGILRHPPRFPTIKTEGLEAPQPFISTKTDQNSDEKNDDAKLKDHFTNGNLTPSKNDPHAVQVTQKDFEKFVWDKLEQLIFSGVKGVGPGILANDLVRQYCKDRGIEDRQSKLTLVKRFAEYANGSALHLTLKITGGKPLNLAEEVK